MPTPLKESSPVSRVITRIKDAIHAHTPEGRREEYREKWSHVLEGTRGLPRFELERRLGEEADKYARDRVVRDIVVAAVATAGFGLGIGGIVAWRNQSGIRELFQQYGAKVKTWTEQTITNAAARATDLGLQSVTRTIKTKPILVTNLVKEAATQAATGLQQAAESQSVKATLQLTGYDAGGALFEGAMKAGEAHLSAAPDQAGSKIMNFISTLLSRATGKK